MKRRTFLRYGAMGLVTVAVPGRLARAHPGSSQTPGDIVSCAIHPAIGVARVGNSPTEFFLGPEVPGPHPEPVNGFKDATGRLKRQAARFRIYGLDTAGNVVKEITAAEAEITWTVHLANAKAAWYEFEKAFDLPEARGEPVEPRAARTAPLSTPRRNAGVEAAERGRLVIDPGPRSIAGANANAGGADGRFAFGSGRFFDQPVPLGELRTDDGGRLLVFGGTGRSGSRTPGQPATTFANNSGWYDDTSDGPVEATVRIGGRLLQATGAWVVVAPPNYAPGIQSIVTLYDVLFEVATRLDPGRRPPRPSFTRQIYPLFQRHVDHQWVNAGYARDFGWGSAGNFLEPSTLAGLSDPSESNRFLRTELFRRFRDPRYVRQDFSALPPYYGDAMARLPTSPRQWMAVLDIQYEWLREWAAGDFEADWPDDGLVFPERLEDLPVEEQPSALDRAVLDECAGGPFHPGCEVTWPVRSTLMYEAPFRLRRRTSPEPDWGAFMTSEIALSGTGPLTASGPGALTRWMAVPWQTDTSSCLSAYVTEEDEYLPTFWPARVPNDVLALSSFQVLFDPAASPDQKRAEFANRVKWLRHLPVSDDQRTAFMNQFIRDWASYGVVTRRPGPGDPDFPETMWVELGFDAPPVPLT